MTSMDCFEDGCTALFFTCFKESSQFLNISVHFYQTLPRKRCYSALEASIICLDSFDTK